MVPAKERREERDAPNIFIKWEKMRETKGAKIQKFSILSLFRCALDPPDDFGALSRTHLARAGERTGR